LGVILDTNALSAVADDEPGVVKIYRQAASMELPVIVLAEYRFGIGQSRRRSEYERLLRELIAATRVLVIEEETSRHYAGIRAALKKAGSPHSLKQSLDRCALPAAPFTTPESGSAL
jgi:tRNA(fMet)-specific endonuclease VapC